MPYNNLLNVSDLSKKDSDTILDYSFNLQDTTSSDLKNKSVGLIFEKYSTRTRLSFHVGIYQLSGNPIEIRFEDLNLQRVESFEDTFKIFTLYLDALVFRTTSHAKLDKASNYFRKPIINGLSDLSHPCQIISDLYTLKNHFNSLEGLSISWFGDMNNVLYSYFELLNLFPEITLNIFTSKKIYEEKKLNFPPIKNHNINIFFSIDETVIKNSDCIMTDVFTSMNDENNEKESLLNQFQVNSTLMSLTKKNCVFMHCLPANKGYEVTEDVLLSDQSLIMSQAKNRLNAQKGILKWLEI